MTSPYNTLQRKLNQSRERDSHNEEVLTRLALLRQNPGMATDEACRLARAIVRGD